MRPQSEMRCGYLPGLNLLDVIRTRRIGGRQGERLLWFWMLLSQRAAMIPICCCLAKQNCSYQSMFNSIFHHKQLGVPNWHYKIFRFNHSGTNVCRRSRVLHIYLYTICLPQKGFLVAFTQSKTMENVGEISNYSPKMCVCRLQRILMCLSHRMVCVQNYDFFCCHEVSICCTMVSGFCLMYG